MPRKSKAASASLSKAGLIKAIAEETGVSSADVREIVDALVKIAGGHLIAAPAGAKVSITGLVSLRKRLAPARPARIGRNPQTGDSIRIKAKPASLDIKAKVDKALREAAQAQRPR